MLSVSLTLKVSLFQDYHGMVAEDRGSKRFTVGGGRGGGGRGGRGGGAMTTWNYRSSFDWADVAGVGGVSARMTADVLPTVAMAVRTMTVVPR